MTRVRATVLLIAAVAFAVRAAFVAIQARTGLLDAPFVSGDALLYLELAQNIAAGQGMTQGGAPTAFVGPGYPVFLALLLRLGLDPLGIGIVQAALGSATAVIVGMIAAQLAPPARRASWAAIAGLSAAIYPHLVFWTGYVLTETLFVFLASGSVLLTLAAARSGSARSAGLAGFMGAGAALTRPPFLAVIAAVGAWWLLRSLASGEPRRTALPFAFLLAAASPLTVWTIRNAVELGGPVVTSTESGYVFYQGNSRDSTGGSRGYVDWRDFQPLTLPPGIGEVERDAAYLRAAVSDIRADPLRTLARWPAKLWNMWRPTYEGASVRNGVITLASYLPLLILGTAGAIALARRGVLAPAFLPVLVLGVWIFIHLVVTGMIRFRLPAETILLATLPAGLGLAGAALSRLRR